MLLQIQKYQSIQVMLWFFHNFKVMSNVSNIKDTKDMHY